MTTKFKAPKDPDAIRDYGVDWTPDIGDANIASSVFTVETGSVAVDQSSYTDKTTTVRLSGGVAGEATTIKNHIVFDDGEEDELTISLTIKEQ